MSSMKYFYNPITTCRICLKERNEMLPIFDECSDIKINCQILYISNILLEFNASVPNNICAECLDELNTSLKFKRKCENSNKILAQYIDLKRDESPEENNDIETCEVKKDSDEIECVFLSDGNSSSAEDTPCLNVDDSASSDGAKKNDEDPKKDLRCGTCDLQCQNKWVLNVHMRTHSGEKPFECDLCKKSFTSNSNMRMHKKTTHNQDKQVCTQCGKSFSCLTYLKRHLVIHSDVKPYGCTICQKRFCTKSYLKEHIARHKGDKRFFCEICASKFISDANLKQHMVVHGIQSRNFKRHECTYCDYKTMGKVDLARHIRKHTGEKPFQCPAEGCKSAFAGKETLRIHMRIHTGEKPFECNECPAKFSRSDKYKNHMLKKHKITVNRTQKRSKLIIQELAEAVENGETTTIPMDIIKVSKPGRSHKKKKRTPQTSELN